MKESENADWDAELLVDDKLLLPDDKYEAVFIGHETVFVFQNPKIFLRFRITSQGEHFGKEIFRAYRVNKLVGKPSKNGKFKLRRGSDLFADISRLLDFKVRPDRISLHSLKNQLWLIKTRTVFVDYKQRKVPDWARYSVVDEIIGTAT